jgi:hypothetical protein
MGDRDVTPQKGQLAQLGSGALLGLGLAGLLLGAEGCGNAVYAIEANSAARRVEEARQLGAEQLAPYNFYYAEEHLKKAREEASQADYGDAIKLASAAEEHAAKAVKLAREAKKHGGGR